MTATKGRRIGTMIMATLMSGLVVSSALVLKTSAAGFTDVTSNDGNSFNAAAMDLTDDAPGVTPMFHRTTRSDGYLNGGQAITRCIKVNYTGDITGSVKMYAATVTGTQTLAPYITVTIDRGTAATGGSGWAGGTSCTGFTTDAQNAAGLIPGVTGSAGATAAVGNAFNNTLTNLQATANYAGGFGAWSATSGSTKSYKITVTVANNNLAKDTDADANLYWEIQ